MMNAITSIIVILTMAAINIPLMLDDNILNAVAFGFCLGGATAIFFDWVKS